MLGITRLDARGCGGKQNQNILQYLKAVEYYRVGDETISSSRWFGRGAEALGLKTGTDVEEKIMDALARGYAPDGTTPLCRNPGEQPTFQARFNKDGTPKLDAKGKPRGRWEGGHRVGFDLTFSADGTFSLLFAGASDEERVRLLKAHTQAVDTALGYLQDQVETRRGAAGKDVIPVGGLVISQHLHTSNRNSESCIHTHALAYGVALGADGQWGTYDAIQLYENKMAAGAIYRSELGAGLRDLGYGVTQRRDVDADGKENGKIYVGVTGITKEQVETCLTRRAEVVAYQAKHGTSMQVAALRSRKEKDDPPYDELMEIWKGSLDELRQKDPTMFRSHKQLHGKETVTRVANDDEILERLHANRAIFSRAELLERIALEHAGARLPEIEKHAADFLERAGIVRIEPEQIHIADKGRTLSTKHTDDRYASPVIVATEKRICELAEQGKDDRNLMVAPEIVDAAVKRYEKERGKALKPEQRAVVDWVAQTGSLCVITGRAGTGKTFVAGAWTLCLKNAGFEVRGCSLGWDAAKKLESETGIESTSVRSLLGQLDRGKIKLTPRSAIVFDEAVMCGTKDMLALMEHCAKAKCKLICQGDGLQLQSIAAGNPMQLAVSKAGKCELTEIRRQNHPQDRKTAEAFYAADDKLRSRAQNRALGEAILQRLENAGQVEPYESKQKAMEAMVLDYTRSPDLNKAAMIAGTKADVRAINLMARNELRKSGRLGTREETFKARDRDGVGELSASIGDRLRFTARSRELSVVNGTKGIVEDMQRKADGSLFLKVRIESDIKTDHGRVVVVDCTKVAPVAWAYASTVHKSQGQSIDKVAQLADAGMLDRQLSLVGFTRMREKFTLYGADADLDPGFLAERMGTDRLKQNASQHLKKQQAPTVAPPIARPPKPRSLRDRMSALLQGWRDARTAKPGPTQAMEPQRKKQQVGIQR
jgi:conjugative relaxase-like TrwC/TraI family protein